MNPSSQIRNLLKEHADIARAANIFAHEALENAALADRLDEQNLQLKQQLEKMRDELVIGTIDTGLLAELAKFSEESNEMRQIREYEKLLGKNKNQLYNSDDSSIYSTMSDPSTISSETTLTSVSTYSTSGSSTGDDTQTDVSSTLKPSKLRKPHK